MSAKVKKPPPLKKRHTKPCKFFQIGRCANTAEECNFAHVFVVPGMGLSPVMSPGVGGGGLCQHCITGQCPSERVNGLRHGHETNSLSLQLSNLQLSPSLSPTSPYDYTYPGPYTVHPAYYNQPWSPSPYKEHPAADHIRGTGCTVNCQSTQFPAADSPSVSNSNSTDSSMTSRLDTPCVDGGSIVGALGLSGIDEHTEGNKLDERDINFPEHSYIRHQSQLRVMDRDHVLPGTGFSFGGHAPGGHAMPPPPPWEAGGMHYFPQPAGFGVGDHKAPRITNPPTRSSSRASSRSKSAKYKTKLCKFYTIEKGCPNGDSCTFIHDMDIPPVPSIVRGHSKSPSSPGSIEDYLGSQSTEAIEDNGKSEKDKSQADDEELEDNKEKKKNFFPITWRVIGGGVLIGGNRAESSGEHRLDTGQDPSSSGGTKESGDGDTGGTVGEKKGLLKFSVVVPRPRSRSTSTPSVRPTMGRNDKNNDNLFSAESP